MFSVHCFLKPPQGLVLAARTLRTELPFHVDLDIALLLTHVLGRKEETQHLPDLGHPRLNTHEDVLPGWGVRASSGHLTGRLSISTLLRLVFYTFLPLPGAADWCPAPLPHTANHMLASPTPRPPTSTHKYPKSTFISSPNLMRQAPYTNQ